VFWIIGRMGSTRFDNDVGVTKAGGKLLTIPLWACVVVAVPLLGSRWVDSTLGVVTVLQSIVPIAGIVVAILVTIAAATRRWRATAAAGALLAVCTALAVPSMLRHTVAPGRDDLVVMSANLEYGGADAQSLVTAARDHRVDVLVLLEITPAAVERLRAAGLDSLLPGSVGRSRQGAGGTIIRSRIPLSLVDPGLDPSSPDAWDEPVVSLHRPAGDVVLRGVHSLPPSLSGAADWRSGLAALETWRKRQPAGQPLVMAGDFNSSEGHPGFRQVAETMKDAHRMAGQGWVRTWPQGARPIPPFVQLDHVLVRGLGIVDAGVVHLPGTDHAAVWARLSPEVAGQV
jgi:endonuclease/exonuclease/phosphatase (EEP) superfamily protein YafD